MTLVIGSLQLGFLYGILALGIYVTFRILNIPDLTAEGSFTLGLQPRRFARWRGIRLPGSWQQLWPGRWQAV